MGRCLHLVAPKLFPGQALSKMDGMLMFHVMLIGPGVAGISLTVAANGKAGLLDLRVSMAN